MYIIQISRDKSADLASLLSELCIAHSKLGSLVRISIVALRTGGLIAVAGVALDITVSDRPQTSCSKKAKPDQ